jgi:hypothetical protein
VVDDHLMITTEVNDALVLVDIGPHFQLEKGIISRTPSGKMVLTCPAQRCREVYRCDDADLLEHLLESIQAGDGSLVLSGGREPCPSLCP